MTEAPIVITCDVEAIYRRGWVAGYAACMERAGWGAEQSRSIAADVWAQERVREAVPWQDLAPRALRQDVEREDG